MQGESRVSNLNQLSWWRMKPLKWQSHNNGRNLYYLIRKNKLRVFLFNTSAIPNSVLHHCMSFENNWKHWKQNKNLKKQRFYTNSANITKAKHFVEDFLSRELRVYNVYTIQHTNITCCMPYNLSTYIIWALLNIWLKIMEATYNWYIYCTLFTECKKSLNNLTI